MKGILILIIDDEPAIREQYGAILKKRGYRVELARDVEEAGRLLEGEPPKLVILDELLPHEDGLSLLERTDIGHQHPDIKVLLISNVDSPELRRRARPLVDNFVLKADYTPYGIADLVDATFAA